MTDTSEASLEKSGSDSEAEGLAVRAWLGEVAGSGWIWYVKRLSANDTLLNRSHQAGPYLPGALVRLAFPGVARRHATELNPDARLAFSLDSHQFQREIRLVWYNNRVVEEGGTRNETRMTGFGGRESPILDPDATGSLAVFAFELEEGKDASLCRAWLCEGDAEVLCVVDMTGPVEPGEGVVYSPTQGIPSPPDIQDRPCWLTPAAMPAAWLRKFPSGAAIVELAVRNLVRLRSEPTSSDDRLTARRDCEFAIFLSVEEAHVAPRIANGFGSVGEFVAFANAVTNRRKSRSGASLELQAGEIFREDGLQHSRGATTEGRKRPDFLFPSAEAYHDSRYPAERLRMLAAKTTCKDRWRQVINEADRIPSRHLLTLQEGVSPNQWKEMHQHGVILVVPKSLHRKYPSAVRQHLLTLDQFVHETAAATGSPVRH